MEISNIAAICPRLQQISQNKIDEKSSVNLSTNQIEPNAMSMQQVQLQTSKSTKQKPVKLTAPLKCHLPTIDFQGRAVTFRENPSQISAKETDCEEKRNVLDLKQTNIRGKALINSLFYVPQLLSMNTLLKNRMFPISRLPWHVYQKTHGISWAFWTTNPPGWISAMQTAGFSLQLVLWPPPGRCLQRRNPKSKPKAEERSSVSWKTEGLQTISVYSIYIYTCICI